jgi:hypothetical protein
MRSDFEQDAAQNWSQFFVSQESDELDLFEKEW